MDSEFEKRLRRQPVKKAPENWRAEILTAAHDAAVTHHASRITHRSWLSTLLWPHPKAWAGLAAVWIAIFALHFSMHDHPPVFAEKSTPPSSAMVAELRQQQKLLAELIGSAEVRVAARQPVLSPKPRSQRVEISAI